MLVEYLPEAASSADEPTGTRALALDEIRSDSGVLALRIGHAAPGPVIEARALSIVLPGTGETLTFDDLVVEHLDSGYAVYSRDRQSTTSTTLVVMGDDVAGTLHYDGAVYGVRPLGDGLTAVYHYDASQLREHSEEEEDYVIPDADPRESALLPQRAPSETQDSRDEIDVLVVHSEGVKRVAGNVDARIALLVLHTHLMYENSGITTRLRVVHSHETSYTPASESGPLGKRDDLDRLFRPGDGFLDEALERRDRYGADVVVLLFREEIDTPQEPYTYGHGFCNATENWRTVMSYNTGDRCKPKIKHFTNPDVHYQGTATGDIELRNVARLINETAIHVANFRPRGGVRNKHTLPLFISASHQTLQGFVRIINRSERDGTVTIRAVDDSGNRSDPVTLSLEAKETQYFNSDDLRDGAPDKGLSGSIADGEGNWRLELQTDLDIEPLA